MLTRLYVDNFRCFVNLEATLKPRQLLLGPNGAGKSSLFDVLILLRDFCVHGKEAASIDPSARFGRLTRTRWQDVAAQTFELDVLGNGGSYRLRLVVDTWGDGERPRVLEETVAYDGNPVFQFADGEVRLFNDRFQERVRYPFDWHRSALATITERKENTRLTWFKRWLGNLLCVQPNPWAMRGIAVQESPHPDHQLANFADWYRHLRQETDDKEYLEDLRAVIDGFDTLRLEGAGEGRREMKLRMLGNGDDGHAKQAIECQLGELSEGQRVLLGLYAVLHFALNPGATICFDEPDNFLALGEIQPWLSKVLDRTESDDSPSQVLIASHHPELLNRMAFQEGLVFERLHGLHTRVSPFDDPARTGLTAAELVARGWDRG